MFTGIITHLGTVLAKTENSLTVGIDPSLTQKLAQGTSISVNGICLTTVSLKKDSFSINFMPETAQKTNIQFLDKGSLVNLELPATSETFLSGHIVQGHIDTVGKITGIKKQGNSHLFTFAIPKTLEKYIVQKGSIAVNGISLTVIDVTSSYFTVGIIPHTWKKTMLHKAKVGDMVNLEADVLAKYLEKLVSRT